MGSLSERGVELFQQLAPLCERVRRADPALARDLRRAMEGLLLALLIDSRDHSADQHRRQVAIRWAGSTSAALCAAWSRGHLEATALERLSTNLDALVGLAVSLESA